MRKIVKGIVAIVCMGIFAFGGIACSEERVTAYEIAVQNGFQGTEAEWLLSLHGADGKDGADLDAEELYQTALANGYESISASSPVARSMFPLPFNSIPSSFSSKRRLESIDPANKTALALVSKLYSLVIKILPN